MKVIQVCSNRKKVKNIPQVDILLWAASICAYKNLGYKVKLYCAEGDLEFLYENHLYELYDEVDSNLLTNNEQLARVNEDVFWACRKIEAIWNEFDLGEEFFYSDNDILMFNPINFNYDLVVWSPENHASSGSIYIDWQYLGKPKDYILPEWLVSVNDAYNCGILYFRNKELYADYRNEFYKYVIGNDGVVDFAGERRLNDYNVINVQMCNAEQRILKGWAHHYNLSVGMIMNSKSRGLCPYGHHYFWYRAAWRIRGVLLETVYINMINKCKQILEPYHLEYFLNKRYSLTKYE